MVLSNVAMHVLCIQLGITCGKSGLGFQGITILSIVPEKDSSRYWVEGFYSEQDQVYSHKINNVPFEVLL